MSQPPTPPGWYPDPAGGGRRYWDGQAWAGAPISSDRPKKSVIPFVITLVAVFVLGGGCIAIIVTGGPSGHQSQVYEPPLWATKTESAFLKAVNERGITNDRGDKAMLDTGRGVCLSLATGQSLNGIAEHWALTSPEKITADEAQFFVRTSAAAFCPEYL